MRTNTIVIALSLALGACSPFSPDLGTAPFQCEPDGMKCPSGYMCQDDGTGARMICVEEGGVVVDAPPDFLCANDSNIEGTPNNDTPASAYVTGIAGSRKMIDFAGLAICPEGDKDTYLVNTTVANQNLEVVVTWDSGQPLSANILGSGGAPLGNGTANGATSVRAYVANLPVGTYYAQVFGGATTKNNYKMTIKVDP